MSSILVILAAVFTLGWVGFLFFKTRQQELQEELRAAVLGQLQHRPAHAHLLAAEVRRVRRVRVPRIFALLHQLEREGVLAGEWDDADGCPRRIYSIAAGAAIINDGLRRASVPDHD